MNTRIALITFGVLAAFGLVTGIATVTQSAQAFEGAEPHPSGGQSELHDFNGDLKSNFHA